MRKTAFFIILITIILFVISISASASALGHNVLALIDFSEHRISTSAYGALAVTSADLDHDGDLDVVAALNKNDQVIGHEKIEWYENTSGDGSTWTIHTLMSFWDAPSDVQVADLDSDGDLDLVVSAHDHTRRISWFESDGSSPPTFTERTVVADGYTHGFKDLNILDMNGDNTLDILVAAGYNTDQVLWFENDGGQTPAFTKHIIDDTLPEPRAIFGADLDGDADKDVILVDYTDNKVIWYESSGGTSPTFTPHVLSSTVGGAWEVYVTDMDWDSDKDIIVAAMGDAEVLWFENNGGSPLVFSMHTIAENTAGVNAVDVRDLDNDNDMDVIYGTWGGEALAWLENSGSPTPLFTKHVLLTGETTCDIQSIGIDNDNDIDSDGDTDILAVDCGEDWVSWWENINVNQPPDVDAGGPYSVYEGGSILLTASGTDPEGGLLNFTWDLNNDGSFETSGQSATFSAAYLNAPSNHTIAVQATDNAGLTATDQATVTVIYNFNGFFPPVDNLPTFNVVKAGQAIPVKFSLSGDQGMDIFASSYPKSQVIACDSTAPVDGIEETVTAGNSSLSYDPLTGTYTYIWKTDTAWASTCRQLVVRLDDDTFHRANFNFIK